MSDRELQELRRRARADSTLEPQLLMARLRAGELTLDQLTCAAALDHEPARIALDLPKPIDPPKLDPANTWPGPLLRLPQHLSQEACVRIALAAGRFAQASSSSPGPADAMARPEEVLSSAEEWAVCPCEKHRLKCERAAGVRADWQAGPDWQAWEVAAACLVSGLASPAPWASLWASVFGALPRRRLGGPWPLPGHMEPGPRLLKAVLDEVLPWALGDRVHPALSRVIGRAALTIDPTH